MLEENSSIQDAAPAAEVPTADQTRVDVRATPLGTGVDYVEYENHRVVAPGQLTGLSVSTIATLASEDGGIGNIYTVTIPSPDAVLQADALTCSYAPEIRARMSFVLKGAEGEGGAAQRQAAVLSLLENSIVPGAQALRFWPVENVRAIQNSELIYPLERAAKSLPGAHLDLQEGVSDELDHSVARLFSGWVEGIVAGPFTTAGTYFYPEYFVQLMGKMGIKLHHVPLGDPNRKLLSGKAKRWTHGPVRLEHFLTGILDTLHINRVLGSGAAGQAGGAVDEREQLVQLRLEAQAHIDELVDKYKAAPLNVKLSIDECVAAVIPEKFTGDSVGADRTQLAAWLAQLADAEEKLETYELPMLSSKSIRCTLDALSPFIKVGQVYQWDDLQKDFLLPTPESEAATAKASGVICDDGKAYAWWSPRIGTYICLRLKKTKYAVTFRFDGQYDDLNALPGAFRAYSAIMRHEVLRGYDTEHRDQVEGGTLYAPIALAANAGEGVANALSNEFFLLPVSADVVGRVAQAIADYFIAVRLVQLFPESVIYVHDISTIPQTAEEIDAWLARPLRQLTVTQCETIKNTYKGGRDVFIKRCYQRYIAPLSSLSDAEILERPELIAVRAKVEMDAIAEALKEPCKVIDGQLMTLSANPNLVRDTRLARMIPWVKVYRQVMNAPCEINGQNRDADSQLRQANAYAEAMDCFCALERYMLHPSNSSKAFARNIRVDSAVPNHYTIAAQDVVFTQEYKFNEKLNLPNGGQIPYLHPDHTHAHERRLSVNAVPGKTGHDHGLVHQVLIRTQQPAERQLNWINTVPLNTGISPQQFTRLYQILLEQVTPLTLCGTNFRPWREERSGFSWDEQLMKRTSIGRLTRVINAIPGIGLLGVCGMMFPVTIGSSQSGAAQSHFVNNAFQVKVLNDEGDIRVTSNAIFEFDESGKPAGDLAGRLHTMQPVSVTYPLPQDTARY